MKTKILDDKVRDEIIIAAAGVFETYGFVKVSMQDISSASGKGRSSLYYYFKNKEEVFDAVIEKTVVKVYAACRDEVSQNVSLVDNMVNFQLRKLAELKAMISQYHLVFLDLRRNPSLLVNKMRILMEEETALFHKMLQWAIDKKEIKHLSEEDTRFLAETVVVALRSFEQEILLFDRFLDFEAKLSWIAAIFCKGLE